MGPVWLFISFTKVLHGLMEGRQTVAFMSSAEFFYNLLQCTSLPQLHVSITAYVNQSWMSQIRKVPINIFDDEKALVN